MITDRAEVPFNCDKIATGEWTEARPFIGTDFYVMFSVMHFKATFILFLYRSMISD